MKDIIKITLSLTGICMAAALILGAVYAKTNPARKDIDKKLDDETVQSLLGFGHGQTPPSDLKIYQVYRYVINPPDGAKTLGYVLPVKDGKFVLATIDLRGKPQKVFPIQAEAAKMTEQATRDQAVTAALPTGSRVTFAETFYVANKGANRKGYVLDGLSNGFKGRIDMKVSLDPDFTLTGVGITESKEDPGLGDEIKRDYFRNQFIGKTKDALKDLKVIKETLPGEYRDVLDPAKARENRTPEQAAEIKKKHVKDDIYALTGATISSRALTRGVVATVTKFVYRIAILNEAIKQENIQVSF